MAHDNPVADWSFIAGEELHGYVSLNRGDHVVFGPLDSIRVDVDEEIFVTPKWLAVQGIDQWGNPMLPCYRVHNYALNPSVCEDTLVVAKQDGKQVAKFGRQREYTIHFGQDSPVSPADVVGLVLDDTGRERATWGLQVPGLVRVDKAHLIQRFADGRGDVVNDCPVSWVGMLFQGVKAYLQPGDWPEDYGDQCNEEFRIHFRFSVEPHLVAQGYGDDTLPPTLVVEAFEKLAADWGDVTIEWGAMLSYGVHTVTISHLLNAFTGGKAGSDAHLLGFDHPTKLDAAEVLWGHCDYFLSRFLEDEIRKHLDREKVAVHLNQHAAPCPILP